MQSVGFAQQNIYTSDALVALPLASDVDNQSIQYTFAWYVNQSLVQSSSSASLDGSIYFERGDSIYVTITPDDGIDTGSAMTSSTIVVENSAPEILPMTLRNCARTEPLRQRSAHSFRAP